MRQRNTGYLVLVPVILVAAAAIIWYLFASLPDPVIRDRFLVLEGGWRNLLAAFFTGVVGISLAAWAWGKAVRPGKAGAYAVTAGTHLLLQVAGQVGSGVSYFSRVRFPGAQHGPEHRPEIRQSVPGLVRPVSSGEERLAFRSQHRGEGPAAGAGQ